MTWVDTTKLPGDYEERRNTETGAAQHRRRGTEEWIDGEAFQVEMRDVEREIDHGARRAPRTFKL